jgi:hypothetical protein
MASSLPALVPGQVTDDGSWARVSRYALCADSGLDPDEWFPVSIEPARARHEAAAAIAVCTACLVRAQCLALSPRHRDIAQHGIWGGLVPAGRARQRRCLPADHSWRQRMAVAGSEGVPSASRVPWLVKGVDVP